MDKKDNRSRDIVEIDVLEGRHLHSGGTILHFGGNRVSRT